MTSETERIRREIDDALQILIKTKGEEIAPQITPILLANLDRGRLPQSVDGRSALLSAYVTKVAETYSALNPYLYQLQNERNAEAWRPLFERMQTWAYNFFLRKNFAADEHTREIAMECATDAATTLLNAHFPYDTEFDPWAHIIVQNACRKFIHKAFKKSAVPEEKTTELDDDLVNPSDPLLEIDLLQKENANELANALGKLSEARRAVIQYIYFDELEPGEIAQKMGKSVSAIYSLQFNALQDLRKILAGIRDNLNE